MLRIRRATLAGFIYLNMRELHSPAPLFRIVTNIASWSS